jgi:hypothetical protein
MSNQNSLEINIDKDYIIGLTDFLSRPSLKPRPTKTGYGLDTSVHITLRKSEILLGVISQFFESEGIEYRYKRQDSEGTPKEILISKPEGISKLRDLGKGTFIQIAEQLEYLVAVDREYEGKIIAGDEERFCKLYKPWVDMHPHWKSKKYTLDFFEEEFNIDIAGITDTFETPNPEYPESISTEYVAGAFDGKGMVSLLINEEPINNTGYGMSISARIAISNPDIRVKPNFIRYFQNHGVKPRISERDNRLKIRFDSVDQTEKFIEKIGGSTTYLYNLCELFYGQLIPAYKDQYHTTKEGFLDMVRAFEDVAPERPRAQYTTKYFEEKWCIE